MGSNLTRKTYAGNLQGPNGLTSASLQMSSFSETLSGSVLGFRTVDLLFLAACLVFIYLHVFLLPATPFFYESDHVALLNDSKRMFEGEVLYRDLFEFTFPGGPTLYYLLINVFGPVYWIVNLAIIAHGVAAAALGIYVSRRVIGDNLYAYLPSTLFIFFGFRWYGVDGEHRMFSPVFAVLAIAFVLTSRSLSRLASAGAACAFSSYFTQQRGLVTAAAIGLFLLFELGFKQGEWAKFLRSSLVLGSSFAITLFLLVLPNLLSAGPDNFYQSTIAFLLHYVDDSSWNGLQTYLVTLKKISTTGVTMTVVAVFYYLLIPLIYVAALIFAWIKRKSLPSDTLFGILLICLVGILLAAGTAGPNAGRLFQISLPALIAFVFLLRRGLPDNKIFPTGLIALLMAFGFILALRLQTAWNGDIVSTPSGRLVFLSPVIQERYDWMLQHASRGDYVYETYNAHVNFPLDLRNPSKMSILLNSGYTIEAQVVQAIEDLKRKNTKYIIWDGTWTREIETRSGNNKLEPFYQYMKSNYRLVQSFTPYDDRDRQVWEKLTVPDN